MKTYIHERENEDGCPTSWAELDTQAPNKVRHECNLPWSHPDNGSPHVCVCGLVDEP